MPDIPYTTQWAGTCLQTAHSPKGICTDSPLYNTRFLWLSRIHIPNGILIGSAIFAGFMLVTSRQTDRQSHRQTRDLAAGYCGLSISKMCI